ncbi:MAG: dihydroorotate dehydrogenase electron transfer subunit [Bacteroidaceae bacterium]|nr:dihydroorotate dehydrogenase electron transfer subunit [Bacteroidaceae bacterium]MBR1755535.1 dihydroorotate dehydrogenase electron transfer subunit [Bacteroidaceae bacterium]
MTKYCLDLVLRRTSAPRPGYVLLQLANPSGALPPMQPGQFVEVRVDGSPGTFLRRPVSINLVDPAADELWLLVHVVGAGTRALAQLKEDALVNVVLPLGSGFTLPSGSSCPLLIGGGVGTAPLLFLGQELAGRGIRPTFLLGGRSAGDLLQLDHFRRFGEVFVTTEDGSAGERGFVTQHSLWQRASAFSSIYTCGPKPMMQAVARLAREHALPCEASLENMMACGLGACLCCVEDTTDGNVCVCKEGPVFNIEKLKW